jgi:hypothetical protein
MFISQLAELLQSSTTHQSKRTSVESIVESLKQKKILLNNIQFKDSSNQTTDVQQNEKLTEIIKRRNEELVELRMKLKEYEDNNNVNSSTCTSASASNVGKSRIRLSPSKNSITKRVLFPLNYNIKVKVYDLHFYFINSFVDSSIVSVEGFWCSCVVWIIHVVDWDCLWFVYLCVFVQAWGYLL